VLPMTDQRPEARSLTSQRRVICGECRAPMRLKDSRFGKFWGCTQYPDCIGTHGAHPDGSPLGIPADAATKVARVEAHKAFDTLWQGGHMTRKAAYAWLCSAMKMDRRAAHISKFSSADCAKLVRLIRERSTAPSTTEAPAHAE
jgi:ssDNA-binding Zn-finger/Zn-ribbon topoisomerase 1